MFILERTGGLVGMHDSGSRFPHAVERRSRMRGTLPVAPVCGWFACRSKKDPEGHVHSHP